ncbi:MAG: hypothetical protein M1838_000633 [Thelocarpon superellum]|nr:MAG: hypothetical protein M1838_000633 [Thelocarpon superellum]
MRGHDVRAKSTVRDLYHYKHDGDQECHEQMETNFFAPLRLIRGDLPFVRAQRHGTLVNVTGIAGLDGLPVCGLCAVSKFALEGMSEGLTREIESFGIRVLIVEPGGFQTKFLSAIKPTESGTGTPYLETAVGQVLEYYKTMSGKQAGDTDKGCLRIYEVLPGTGLAKDVPMHLRLPLAKDCARRTQAKVQSLQTNLYDLVAIWSSADISE